MVNYLRAYYYLRSAIKRAYWPRKKLMDFQNKRLREIIRYAYENVPFYHEKFRQLGLKPEDIKTVDDLQKLPIIQKEDVKKNLERMVSLKHNINKLKMLKTSGSTGEALCFYISKVEDEFRKAKHLRANIALGQRPRDRWVTITAPVHFSGSTRLQRILRIYCPLPVSVFDDVTAQFSKIEKFKPDILDGYASSLLLLAKEAAERGRYNIKPKLMISGAEVIDASSRRFIEETFEAPLFDQYAAAEFERLAWQCEEKAEYHIDADSVVLEFVDRDGENVGPGETGEIVCTSLFNYAMPFIRYALGDLGRLSKSNDCPCRRSFPLMEIVEGRTNDIIILPDGRVMSSLTLLWGIDELSFYNDMYKFRIIQRDYDLFQFLIVPREKGCLDRETAEKELKRYFSKQFNVGDEIDFRLDIVDDIPLEKTGKFRVVISHVADRLFNRT